MKRIVFLLVLCLPLILKAQTDKWWIYPSLGIDLGGTIPFPLSDIPDGAKAIPKINLCFGLGFEYHVSSRWNFGLEAGYHKLAFSASADVRSESFYDNKHQNAMYFTGHTNTDVGLSFLEFPVMAIYSIGQRGSVLLGCYYSRILSGFFQTKGTKGVYSNDKAITDAAQMPGNNAASYKFDSFIDDWDAGLMIGYRYAIKHRLKVWSNLKLGLKSIFEREFNNIDYEMYQLRLNAGVSFTFFNRES